MTTILDPVATARGVLAAPTGHSPITIQLAQALVDLHARAGGWEDEADRAAAEVAARGKRLRAAGVEVESTVWDGPGIVLIPGDCR